MAEVPYTPADESHLPDAVSRNGITNTNATSWYSESALASSPILRADTYTGSTSRLDDDDDDDDLNITGPSNDHSAAAGRVTSTLTVNPSHAGSSMAPDDRSIGQLDDTADLDDADGVDGDLGESSAETPDFKDLSKRADDIIANARKRLNLVDGGLRGLRSSLMSPTFSSYDNLSRTPSPGSPAIDQDENGNPLPVRAMSVSKPIDLRFKPARRKSAAGHHARMASDTSVPTPNGSAIKGSRSLETMRFQGLGTRQGMPRSPLELRSPTSLQPVNESAAVDSTSNANLPQRVVQRGDKRFSATPVVTPGGRLSYPIPPRESSTRFRDLQSRANAIEGRMSSVRQRLREDSERRRSFQSSRPSTSTGHRSSPEDGFGDDAHVTPGDERPPPSYEDVAFMDGQQDDEQSNDFYEYQRQTERLHGSMDDYPDYDDEDDTDYHSLLEEDEGGVDGEYGDYDDLPPEEMAHEQRADAFDYESFILSSLLGSMDRGRASSVSSTDTASTTRGPALEQDEDLSHEDSAREHGSAWTGYQNGGSANASSASLSTMQSFATAAEDGIEDDSGTSSEDGIDTMDDVWPMPPTRGTTRSATHTRQNSTMTASGTAPGMPAPPPQQPPPLTPPQQQRLLKQQQEQAQAQQLLLLQQQQQQQQKRPVSMALAALLTSDATSPALALNPADQALVYGMAASIRDICMRLAKAEQAGDRTGASEADGTVEEATWRQRLDDARRILNGEALPSA